MHKLIAIKHTERKGDVREEPDHSHKTVLADDFRGQAAETAIIDDAREKY
jgi:hypothetical protein